jgi:tetratricopeptide (TPR) repeat protein
MLQTVLAIRALKRPWTTSELTDDLPPGAPRADALASLAAALETLNDRKGAREMVQLAFDEDSDHLWATIVAARLERRDNQQSARDRLLRVAKKHAPLPSAYFTILGHVHDRLGEYDAAFTAFTDAKKAAAQELGEPTEAWKRHYIDHVRRYRSWYSPAKAAAWTSPAAAAIQATPVFFVGFPRSGTTLFEQMLDSHPRLATTGETVILGRLRTLLPTLIGRLGRIPEILDDLAPDEIATLANWYLKEVEPLRAAKPGAVRTVDKMPLNIVEIAFIRRVFPEAQVIVALRDPRDVVLSCYMQNFRVNAAMAHFLTLEGTATLYAEVMGLWLHYRTDPGLRAFEYRYEDLVSDTESLARKAFAFLGEPWDDRVLAYQNRAAERLVSTPSYADVTAPIYTRSIARWQRYEKYLAPVLPVLAPFVRAFGYAE